MKATPPPVITRFLQVCVATPDLDETCSQFAALGISPFKIWRFRPPVLFDRRFRGSEGDFTMDLAIAWAGTLQVEVFQPVSGSSLAAEFLAANGGGPGVWHVMVGMPGSWKRRVASLSAAFGGPAQSAAVAVPVKLGPITIPPPPGEALRNAGATRFAYFDAAARLGTTLEIGKFPAGLSLRAASALGKPDAVIGESDSTHAAGSIVTGIGLQVADVDEAADAWSRCLPSLGQVTDAEAGGAFGSTAVGSVGGVRLELYGPPAPGSVRPPGYVRIKSRKAPAIPRAGDWFVLDSAR